jgi:hypothetical protein
MAKGPTKPPGEPTKAPHLRVVSDTSKKAKPRRSTKTAAASASDGAKSRIGRPPHQPTDATRSLVRLGLAAGMTHEQVSKAIGVLGVNSFKKHYAAEIEDGGAVANLKVAATLFSIATDKNHPKSVTAGIFWMKNRMGFNADSQRRDDSDDDEGSDVEFTIGIGEKRGA